jgi:hypothetical protein
LIRKRDNANGVSSHKLKVDERGFITTVEGLGKQEVGIQGKIDQLETIFKRH